MSLYVKVHPEFEGLNMPTSISVLKTPLINPSLASEQKILFALGAGIFGYQVIAELVHKFAQQRLENWSIRPAYSTRILTLCWIGFIMTSTSLLLVQCCFIATGVMAFVIYRPPFVLGNPPLSELPKGLIDMVAQVETHPEWAYGANAEDLVPKFLIAQAESWKQNILLFGHTTNINILVQNLAWKIKNNKLPAILNLENIKKNRLDSKQLKEGGLDDSSK